MKEPINKLDKNAVSLIRTNSHYKGVVVVHVQQKKICQICQLEINTDWKSVHFHGPEKAITLAKK